MGGVNASPLFKNSIYVYPPVPELTDQSPMPFGQHKGKRMIDVPAKYLLWLLDNGISAGNVKDYIINNLDGLKQEAGIAR